MTIDAEDAVVVASVSRLRRRMLGVLHDAVHQDHRRQQEMDGDR